MSELDRHFADFVARFAPGAPPLLVTTAELVSRALGEGHICLDLTMVAGRALGEAQRLLQLGEAPADVTPGSEQLPDLAAWRALVTSPDAEPVVTLEGTGLRRPLVLDDSGRLYLQRYHAYETFLAQALVDRAGPDPSWDQAAQTLARTALPRLFPDEAATTGEFSWQRLAAFAALRRNLTVISGGPGTGKTTTVARILALLVERSRDRGDAAPRIRLAAPTGKAAARMADSIKAAKGSGSVPLRCDDEIRDAIPETASTLHRLLGYRHNSPFFRHDRGAPLDAEVVVVDEASMVDLPLMAKLLDALRPGAKLILIGDMDQLASVEPGYVLGDICAGGRIDAFTTDCADEYVAVGGDSIPAEFLTGANGLSDCFVRLRRSHRFTPGGAIDRVSRAVNGARTADESTAAVAVLRQAAVDEPTVVTVWERDAKGGLPTEADDEIRASLAPFLQASDPLAALSAFDGFRLLCAHRKGHSGVEAQNRAVEKLLGLAPGGRTADPFYAHRPVLITTNDYGLGLFNGDVGVVLDDSLGRRRVFFRDVERGVRSYAPRMLPAHETCFAMTVHKSQGSEFDRVLIVMPDRDSPVVTKELVYTAITRSRTWAGLVMDDGLLAAAVLRRCASASGLRERLERLA